MTEKGIVYFDEPYGLIRGVTFKRQQSMDADFCSIEVDAEIATALMTGAEAVHDWTVGHAEDGTLALKPLASFRVELRDGGGRWEIMRDEPVSGPVQICVQIDNRGWAKVILTTISPTIVLVYPKSHLTFTVVVRGDPDAVVSSINVSIDDLNRHRTTTQAYRLPPGKDVDILAPPLSPVAFRLERVPRVRGSVYLSADLRDSLRAITRCEEHQVETIKSGGLLFRKKGAKLILSLLDDGGLTYARENTGMLVAVCSRDGPDHLICTERVSIADLDAGKKVVINLPRGLKTEDFDVYTELVYAYNFLVQ